MRTRHADVLETIRSSGKLEADTKQKLDGALDEFAQDLPADGKARGRVACRCRPEGHPPPDRSVKKTQQITRAMRMVAAAKLRRAQDAIRRGASLRRRACARRSARSRAASRTASTRCSRRARDARASSRRDHLGPRPVRRLQRQRAEARASALVADAHARVRVEVTVICVGRKAIEYFRRRRPKQRGETARLRRLACSYANAVELAERRSRSASSSGEVDEVVLVFSEFVSALTQTPRSVRLLPVARPRGRERPRRRCRYEIEPERREAARPCSCRRRSSSRSSARCSRTRPASTRRAWRRWSPRRATPRS